MIFRNADPPKRINAEVYVCPGGEITAHTNRELSAQLFPEPNTHMPVYTTEYEILVIFNGF